MPSSSWFESDRAQKTAVAFIGGFLLLAAVSVAWAVSGASLRTLVPVGQTAKANFTRQRRKSIDLVPRRFGQIRLNVPRNWTAVDRSPEYLLNTPHKVWQDPQRSQRWLAVARVSQSIPKPQRVSGDVDLIRTMPTSGQVQYLFHLHDHVETDARMKVISRAYEPLLQTMVQSARLVEEDER